MKKIFTFMFFAGLMTTAMAQDRNSDQHRNQNQANVYAYNGQANGSYGQSNGGYNQSGQVNNNGQYKDYNQNNGYHSNNQGYTYNMDRRGDDRSFEDRRFHSNDHYDHRNEVYDNRREFGRLNRGKVNARVSIRFGQPGCYY